MSTQPLVRIGARGSRLSLAQAGQMQRRIAAALGAPPEEAERVAPITVITTTGDRIQDRRLLEIGGKALFTKEIEEALIAGRIDCAIHSMKDVPAEQPPGLCIAAVPEREDVRDAFISLKWDRLEDLPKGAVLGTASLRRQAQSLFRRPDLRVELLRGNVDTRLAKLEAGEADAILLAKAGLNRLGLGERPKSLIEPREAPPAPGQGALAIQTREEDRAAAWIAPLHHRESELTVAAERGALTALEGSCRTPVGAYARVEGETLTLLVEALSPDGRQRFRREGEASLAGDAAAAARDLGLRLGRAVAEEGGEAILLPAP